MIVKNYDKYTDKSALKDIMTARNMDPALVNTLPKWGLVALDAVGDIVAAGFFRQVEGNIGLLDSFITNPDKASDLRDKALDMLLETFVVECKRNDVKLLLGFSADKNCQIRMKKHGLELNLDWLVQSMKL